MISKLLLVTTKWNTPEFGVDGGSMTAVDILTSLRGKAQVDILTSDILAPYISTKYGNQVHTFCESALINNSEKFEFRKAISEAIGKRIKTLSAKYDKIIIIHIFNALFLPQLLPHEEIRKVVLFPMFLSPSYEKSNETVPCWYKEKEKDIVTQVDCIVTPSAFEKQQLSEVFMIPDERIRIIPRMVSEKFYHTGHDLKNNRNLVLTCTSSFRKQKRLSLAIDLLLLLKRKGIK